jgi:hypothetical protein
MESIFTTITLWVELAFFLLVFLFALPILAKLVVALLKRKAQWPGDRHYAEPENVSERKYHDWYMKGDIPLFSGFILFFLGVLAAGVLSLLVVLNTYNLQDTISIGGWNLVTISYMIIIVIGFYCAIQLWKKMKHMRRFYTSISYLHKKGKKQK